MIREELKSWISRMIDAGRSLSDIQLTLKQRSYSQAQLNEISAYVEQYILSKKKTTITTTQKKEFVYDTVLNPSVLVGVVLAIAVLLLALIPDMIQYVVVVAYSSVVAFIIAFFLDQVLQFMHPETATTEHAFILTFIIIILSKIIGGMLTSDSVLGTILLTFGLAIFFSLLFEKGDIQKALINVFIIAAGSFMIDFFVTQLFQSQTLAPYVLYFKKVLI